uniref:AAA+ ATPase domain-containing protein n=1 Tax=viral metagenome TaxID=1070528 RepID=A0A6C0AXI1_9ZZZZ|tara:strand:+ start:41227 stop:43185 length:1959 start_codon:yes stop_codon:yes gene_type:complete
MKFILLTIYTLNVYAFQVKNAIVFSKPIINSVSMSSYKPTDLIKTVSKNGMGTEWTYNDFINNLNSHNIDAATITDTNNLVVIDKNYQEFILPENLHLLKGLPELTSNIINKLVDNHINFDIYSMANQGNFLSNIPFPIQFIFFYILGSYAFNFIARRNMMNNIPDMKKQSQILDSKDIEVTFDDVAGCDESKFELMEVVDFLKDPKKFESSGAKIPSGILLEGPPGTGKTLLARAVAGEAGVSFISASGSEFIEMFVGIGASRVRNLFEQANKNSPCVIFIDEIDAIGRQRGAGFNSGNDEREQTLNQILTNMDGFDKRSGIIVLGATNRVDILDSALTRPGRFDRKVIVPLPDKNGRKKIFKVHLKNKMFNSNIDLDEITELTSGFSGADIANLVNEAAILSVRYNKTVIDKKSMLDAFEKVTIGLPKVNDDRSSDIIELVAYHEAGHTVIAKLFDDVFDLRKITINANNNGAGGYTLFTPNERYSEFPTKKYLLSNLMVALGGRAAETLLYDRQDNFYKSKNYEDAKIFNNIDNLDITTGASNDLKQANSIARTYINLFGYNDTLGLYDSGDGSQPFLGRDLAMGGDKTSEYSKDKMDKEVERIINFAYDKTLNIIKQNINSLDKIANLLIEKISIDYNQLKNIDVNYL